jgi:hypothetical protein
MKRLIIFLGVVSVVFFLSAYTAGATDITAQNLYTTNLYVTGQPAAVPGQVQGLTVTVSQTTAILAWTPNPSSDAVTQYLVEDNGAAAGASAVASYTVKGLQPNTQYSFTVAGVNSLGTGSYSQAVQVTTLPDYATPPVGLAVYTATAITWTASPITQGVQKYNIYLAGQLFDNTAGTSYDFAGKNLIQGQTYTVTVTAVNGLGESQPSAELYFTYGLSTPADLQVYNLGDNHAYIEWTYPNLNTAFTVNVAGQVYDTAPGQLDYQLDGLSPNTQYTVTVQAIGPDGKSLSALSNVLTFTTEAAQGFDQVSLITDSIQNLANLGVFWVTLAGIMLAFPIVKLIRAAVKSRRRWH